MLILCPARGCAPRITLWAIAGALNEIVISVAIGFGDIDRREEIDPEERINAVFPLKRIFTFHLCFVDRFSTNCNAVTHAFTVGACSFL